MELAPTTNPRTAEAWTAAVPWARPWHRPARRARMSMPMTLPARRHVPDVPAEQALVAALAELAAARAALANLPPADDPWPELMARHAVFLAARRVRERREALAGQGADVWWRPV